MKLELGTYVDCSDLTDEQRQKLLDKFVELVGDTYKHVDIDTLEHYSPSENYINLVCFPWLDTCNIWFHDLSRATKQMSYYDFFPEELETTPTAPVKRVKQIDLERNNKTFEIKIAEFEVKLEDMKLEDVSNYLHKCLKVSLEENAFNDILPKVGEPVFTLSANRDFELICEVYQTYGTESEEDYQQRIKREKDLNDMYNADIQNLTKKILHLQQDLDDVSAILNGQTTLGASQVMDIKKIIGGK